MSFSQDHFTVKETSEFQSVKVQFVNKIILVFSFHRNCLNCCFLDPRMGPLY